MNRRIIMELKDFIKETVSQISLAIIESNSDLRNNNVVINPKRVAVRDNEHDNIYGFMLDPDETDQYRRPVHQISFNVAVTSSEVKGKNGKIGINVAGIGMNRNGTSESKEDNYSHLSFKLPIALPTGDVVNDE